MDATDTTREASSPAALYSERLKELRAAQSADKSRERALGYSKVAVAFATIAAALLLLYYIKFLWLLLVPAGVFAWLPCLHEKRLQQIRARAARNRVLRARCRTH